MRRRSCWGPRLPQSQVGWQTGSLELAFPAWPRDFQKHLSEEEWNFTRPGGPVHTSRLNRPLWAPGVVPRGLLVTAHLGGLALEVAISSG